MTTRPFATTVNGVVTGIRIDVNGPRLMLEGVLLDETTGATVRSFSEDVTPQLTAAQLQRVTDIVARAQAWIDAK